MQDLILGYAASATHNKFYERSIYPIFWPPFSPNLNLIETVWNVIKDYIAKHFPEDITYGKLRDAVYEVWNIMGADEL
jgi:transposase